MAVIVTGRLSHVEYLSSGRTVRVVRVVERRRTPSTAQRLALFYDFCDPDFRDAPDRDFGYARTEAVDLAKQAVCGASYTIRA